MSRSTTKAHGGHVIEQLESRTADQLLNLCLDTITKSKQALVFCNTKRGAESQAEKIAKKLKGISDKQQRRLFELSEQILKALSSPTKQCKRLALCVKSGIAFHHAGLNAKQREIIEDAFRANELFIICSTPTLAMGLDLPAFRSIVRDVKRFNSGSGWGMSHIPVLEYEQMSGRAGRPGKEDWGEAIMIASTAGDAEELREKYIHGKPEEIYSKLAVEPVLRTYLLSLIATGFIRDRKGMYAFFDKTFYAAQYVDLSKLHQTIDKMLLLLEEWEFIRIIGADGVKNPEFTSPFQNADELYSQADSEEKFRSTPLGVRVAQLYLDPYTAAFLIKYLKKATDPDIRTLDDFALLHLLSSTLEIRPLLRPRTKEYDLIEEKLVEVEGGLLVPEPAQFSYEYEEFLAAIKTAMFFEAWINEIGEEDLLEIFGIRPGEINAKVDKADWLLYSCEELCKLLAFKQFLTPLGKMRVRLKYGVKEELLNLLRIKGIGKVRARLMHRNGIKTVGDVKKAEVTQLAMLIGKKTAISVKEHVGEKVDPAKILVPPRKRKGQKSLVDW